MDGGWAWAVGRGQAALGCELVGVGRSSDQISKEDPLSWPSFQKADVRKSDLIGSWPIIEIGDRGHLGGSIS